jgi:hypothetical protein
VTKEDFGTYNDKGFAEVAKHLYIPLQQDH